MMLTIPTWLLWVLGAAVGIPLALAVLILIYVGAMVCWAFKDGIGFYR